MKSRIIDEMKQVFGNDRRRIDHALHVLEFAETILETENADTVTVQAAAILHDIGIQEAERKYGSSAGRYQEIEGPSIARTIMEKLYLDKDTIDHVCRIVGSHHSAKDIDTSEFRVIWDADWLVNIPDLYPDAKREKIAGIIERTFKTLKGRALAQQLYLS